MKISEKYRSKALACEKLAREVSNHDFRCAWAEIAIEWHALAGREGKSERKAVVRCTMTTQKRLTRQSRLQFGARLLTPEASRAITELLLQIVQDRVVNDDWQHATLLWSREANSNQQGRAACRSLRS